jgi:hypothetical protein
VLSWAGFRHAHQVDGLTTISSSSCRSLGGGVRSEPSQQRAGVLLVVVDGHWARVSWVSWGLTS